MTVTMERPQTQTIVVPDERRGVRVLPTMDEQRVVDLYAEGNPHALIWMVTGVSESTQKHTLRRLGVPFPTLPCNPNRPRFLSDAELLAGERAANRRMDALADARLAASAAELAAWEMR